MKFSEKDFIPVPLYQKSFIYFLIKENEVVYVGKTTQGISRPFSHKDKDYDSINIIYCDEKDLDELEDMYISKYKPPYNKLLNFNINYTLSRVRDEIRKKYDNKKFSKPTLKKIIKALDIPVFIENGSEYIKKDDYQRVLIAYEKAYKK